ncbi:MAG: hypothetical protein KGL53_01375, partial [Elusimicrobia bacterium]|nr:hypothetical protein [Elusimicrobiota bacterium]
MEDPTAMSDDALEAAVKALAAEERTLAARLLALLARFEVRGLPPAAGFADLYDYCRRELGWAEGQAYERVWCARAGLEHPAVLERLGDGRLTPAALLALRPVLTPESWEEVLKEAEGMGRREAEDLAAELDPRADLPDELGPDDAAGAAAAARDG